MDPTILEGIKLLITAAVVFGAYLIRRDLIPFIRSKTTENQIETAKKYADTFVYMAQQVFSQKTGAERKAIVTKALKEALTATNISLTDQFIDDLIEAAVKGLRIAEASGGKVSLTNNFTSDLIEAAIKGLRDAETDSWKDG